MAELESAFASVIAEIERLKRVEKAAQDVSDAFGANSKYWEDAPWLPKIHALTKLRAALEKKQ